MNPENTWRRPRKLRGAGDIIALAAKPIARAIDRVAGTKLENCGACAKRQASMNAAIPFPTLDNPQPNG
jgi:hypothetical protein